MQFVKTDIGLINLAFVQRIDHNSKGFAILYLADGKMATTDQIYEDFEGEVGPFVPDQTGTHQLKVLTYEGKVDHYMTPVVAWQITQFGARPIYASPDDEFLVYSNGYVESCDRSFDSVSDALKDFAEKTGATL